MTVRPSSRQVRGTAGAAPVQPDSPVGSQHGAESSVATARAAAPHRSRTLGDSLREARLRHRYDRLQLVIGTLYERLGNLNPTSARTRHLVAAIHGFQQELASVCAELRTLHSSTQPLASVLNHRIPCGPHGRAATRADAAHTTD
jgi:hypothetical protein